MENKQEFQTGDQGLLPFDPIVIVRDVLRKWFLILVVAVCVGVAAFVLVDRQYTPVYESSATLVITTHSSFTTVYDNINSTTSLASVFSEILNSSVLRKKILEQLQMTNFSGKIVSSVIDQTNLLTLKVQSNDPRTSFMVIQAIIENHEIVTYDVMGNIAIEVLQYPQVPAAPINSNNAWGAMSVMIVAAIGACAVLAFLSVFRDTIRSRTEAERKLDCWCLGEIHHERKFKSLRDLFRRRKKSILITKPETGFRYVSTIGRLCRRVEQHMHNGKVLMVTSVMENEGKSTVAVNLALSMAKKHEKVLLIDCDLHKPACRKILEAPRAEYCVNDVIAGTAALEDAVVTDRLSRLNLLYAKKVDGTVAGDIINSGGLKTMLRQARELYDFIVIDLPPMSVTTDSEYIMEYADASLLVVRQNEVSAGAVNQAISVLQNGRARLLGCVLNNVYVSFLTTGEGYDGGYGSRGYGHYGKYGHYGAYASNKTYQ